MSTTFSSSPYSSASYSGADMMATLSIRNTDQHKNVTYVLGELQTLSYSTHMDRSGVRKLGNVNASDFTNGPRTVAGSLVFAVFNRHIIRPIIEQLGINQEILPDELPPFDITISFANEYGHDSVMRIYGVRLVNEGQVCSINDIYMENTYQYVATNIQILEKTDLLATDLFGDNPNGSNTSDGDNIKIEDLLNSNESNLPEQDAIQLIVRNIGKQTSFNVTSKLELLNLTIGSDIAKEKTYAVSSNQWPFYLALAPGEHYAKLTDVSGTLYGDLFFTVLNTKPNPPIVTDSTSTSLIGTVQEGVTRVLITDNKTFDGSFDVVNQKFVISNLTPSTLYDLQSESALSVLSDKVSQSTPVNNARLFEEFKSFLEANNLSNKDFENILVLAQDYFQDKEDIDFISACYEIFNQNKQTVRRGHILSESCMHLISYFDLAYKEKNCHFDFKNKWLGQIEPNALSSHYKAYDKNGIAAQAQQNSGMVKYQQLYNNTLEKLTSYRPSKAYQQSIQQTYLLAVDTHKDLKQIFNARYGTLPIDLEYGFYDQMLYSEGAYISIANRNLKACLDFSAYNLKDIYFVFKDDIHLEISFKAKADKSGLNLDALAFFNPNKTYIVYLEYHNQPISKSIVIKNNVPSYLYDTFTSLSVDKKMQDFVQEICLQESDAFNTFCYGFYLLVNRKKLSANYIDLFDKWLFSSSKSAAVNYYLLNNAINFTEEVTMLYFDEHGDFVKTIKDNIFAAPVVGYLIWFTPNHKMRVLNFKNI